MAFRDETNPDTLNINQVRGRASSTRGTSRGNSFGYQRGRSARSNHRYRPSWTPQAQPQNPKFGDTATERKPMKLAKLRYLKVSMPGLQLMKNFGVKIEFDIDTSHVVVTGNRTQVLQALQEISHVEEQFFDQIYSVSDFFVKSFNTIEGKNVIAELRKRKIYAGYSFCDSGLHICSGSEEGVRSAFDVISKLITEWKFPETGPLSDARVLCITKDSGWTDFLSKLIDRYRGSHGLHIQYDASSKQLDVAHRAYESKLDVLNELENFFEQVRKIEEYYIFDEAIRPLILVNETELLKMFDQYNRVTLNFACLSSSGYCILKSSSEKAIEASKAKLNEIVHGISTETRLYQKPGEIAWLGSPVGVTRMDEFSKLTHTIFSKSSSNSQSPRALCRQVDSATQPSTFLPRNNPPPFITSSPKGTLQAVHKLKIEYGDISKIEADGLVSSQGAIAKSICSQFLSRDPLRPGLQCLGIPLHSARRNPAARPRSVKVFHLHTSAWNHPAIGRKDLQSNIERAFAALSSCKAIAVPAIGTGRLGYPHNEVANVTVQTLLKRMSNAGTESPNVTIVIHPDASSAFQAFQKEYSQYLSTSSASAPALQPTKEVQVTFKGLKLPNVESAFDKLETEFTRSMSSIDWARLPQKQAITKLTQQEVDDIYSRAVDKNLMIVFELEKPNIVLEGLHEDVHSMRGEIDAILHKKSISSLPPHWDQADEASCHVELAADCDEFQQVIRKFQETCAGVSIQVSKIHRIQNEELYTQYEAQKTKVKKELKDDRSYAIEAQLWHGTSVESTRQICAYGFNRSFAGKNGTRYGQGTYFSTLSRYSIGYCSDQREKCIILAKVVTGRYRLGDKRTTSNNLPLQYHSTVDCEENPTKYVVYHDTAAYPEYVMYFHQNLRN